jgi:phage antirepressor YoqD-like protein
MVQVPQYTVATVASAGHGATTLTTPTTRPQRTILIPDITNNDERLQGPFISKEE